MLQQMLGHLGVPGERETASRPHAMEMLVDRVANAQINTNIVMTTVWF